MSQFELPVWKGEKDSTVLVNADCGAGDTICFYRWLKQIENKIVLRCDASFQTFLNSSETVVEWIDEDNFVMEPKQQVINKEDPIPDEVDYVINIMDIPNVSNIEVVGQPYLEPSGNDFLMPLRHTDFTKIGLCWSGSERSIPVEKFDFLSEVRPFGLVKHQEYPDFIMDVRHYMKDWLMTAKLISIMHLVISVDTAVAHLSASMGVPTWLLLSEDADQRWGDEETTPWYDSMKIFRKKTTWDELLEEVKWMVFNQCPQPDLLLRGGFSNVDV